MGRANDYTGHAIAQHRSAEKLRAYCLSFNPEAKSILDLGCGNGYETELLTHLYPRAKIVAIDCNADRILEAKSVQRQSIVDYRVDTIEGYQGGEYDLVVSNASLHWLSSVEGMDRFLAPNGVVIMSYYTSDTFRDLDSVLNSYFGCEVGLSAQRFLPFEKVKSDMSIALNCIETSREIITLSFKSMIGVLRHIRNTGTRGEPAMPSVIWTPNALKMMEAIYLKKYGKIQLTYDIIYSVWRK
jgi:SAM-dependent methyltransferase